MDKYEYGSTDGDEWIVGGVARYLMSEDAFLGWSDAFNTVCGTLDLYTLIPDKIIIRQLREKGE